MLPVEIIDGHGSGNRVRVGGEGEQYVVVHPHPPLDEVQAPLPFRQYFTDTGASTGDNDMIVNASLAVPQDFYIEAVKGYDIYIKTMAIQITDPGGALDEFGALTELTNGVKWVHKTNGDGEYVLHDGIKANLEYIKTALGQPAFGNGDKAFRADIKGGSSDDTFLPVIDCAATFGTPWGLRLKKGSTDRIIFRIQDNLTGMNVFNTIGYGIRF